MKFFPLLFILGLSIAFSACARSVRLDSYASPQLTQPFPKNSKFYVMENTQVPNPLFDRTVKTRLEKLLHAEGYTMSLPESADYVMDYAYDMQSRRDTSYSPRFSPGFAVGTYSGRTSYLGGMDYNYWGENYPVYTARLRVRVLIPPAKSSLQPLDNDRILWVGEITAESSSADFRYLMDAMTAAAFKSFGRDTGRNVKVKLKKDDPLLKVVQNAPDAKGVPNPEILQS